MNTGINTGFTVLQPGILSLVQDAGRFGKHAIGLTNGGPLDKFAFDWANKLLDNEPNAPVIEASVGGLTLKANADTQIAVTGGDADFIINGKAVEPWSTHAINAGDEIAFAYAVNASRHYLAVKGGFTLEPMFGSTATVAREKIGGLDGTALKKDDHLPYSAVTSAQTQYYLPNAQRPDYTGDVKLRVVLGYQHAAFSRLEKARFFNLPFTLSDQCDRMGFRLSGPAIQTELRGMLSEGICYGAIQIPADGQPIILLNDRQTIGGYPKIGSVFSLDIPKLTQRLAGTQVSFEPITIDEAQRQLHLAHYRFQHTVPQAR